MDINRITEWINDTTGWLDPPGCETTFAPLPVHDRGCCTVGIVHEHRFSFFFWGLYTLDDHSPRVALVSIDAHDDVGVPSDVIPDDLDNLNIQQDGTGAFCLARSSQLE